MSMGPLGAVGSAAAGSPLAQSQGAEQERAQKDDIDTSRRADSELKSEKAAGIGQTEEDAGAGDRDADGRRLWETPPESSPSAENDTDSPPRRSSPDPTGQRGQNLDLTG